MECHYAQESSETDTKILPYLGYDESAFAGHIFQLWMSSLPSEILDLAHRGYTSEKLCTMEHSLSTGWTSSLMWLQCQCGHPSCALKYRHFTRKTCDYVLLFIGVYLRGEWFSIDFLPLFFLYKSLKFSLLFFLQWQIDLMGGLTFCACFSFFLKLIVNCSVLSMWGKIMIPMYRLWLLQGVYGLHGLRCPMSKRGR